MVTSLVLLFLVAASQDFGTEWIDRVNRELQWERETLESKPPAFQGTAGLFGYYDGGLEDFIVLPFVRIRFDYEEPTFEFAADLLVDYRHAFQESGARGSDERLFLRARTIQPRFSLEIAEVLLHESEPFGIVFPDRAERLVSETLLRATLDLTDDLGFEAGADLEIIRILDDDTTHVHYRMDGAFVFRLGHELDLLAQGGYLAGGDPTEQGYVARVGFRGDLTSRLSLEVWAGYSAVESEGTADLALHVRYEATERWTFSVDFERRFDFAGGPGAFEVVNRVLAGAEFEATEQLTLRARLQWEAVVSGADRRYGSASLSATYRPADRWIVDGGATYRWGDGDSGDVILHLGVAITF